MKDKAELFWQKFAKIKDKLMDIESFDVKTSNNILEELDKDLKQYSEGVDFILSDLNSNGRNLIFTANCDLSYFQDVITLVENAPIIDFWEFTAFEPPMGKNQTESFEGVRLKSKDLFFLPLESDERPDKIGIEIGVRNIEDKDSVLGCAYFLCGKMVGEYYLTTMTDYFDIVLLPENYKDEGFLPLDYLCDFFAWKIENSEKGKKKQHTNK